MLNTPTKSIYTCCRKGLSKFSLTVKMMNIKTDHNLPKNYMDALAKLFKKYLPEDNLYADSYHEIKKLVYSIELPSKMIDVRIENCRV